MCRSPQMQYDDGSQIREVELVDVPVEDVTGGVSRADGEVQFCR